MVDETLLAAQTLTIMHKVQSKKKRTRTRLRKYLYKQALSIFFAHKKPSDSNHYSGLNHKEREAIGYKCKRFLDIGRMRYLEEHNFKVDLVYYVDPATSLENCALIAVPK